MGNTPTKGLQKKGKKYVHWSNADKPSPPGKPQLVPGTPHNQPDVVTIRWEVPTNDGGAPVTGYLVEHRRTGSPHWVRATPVLVPASELTLSGLEPGWRYQFRVSAENAAGMSEPGDLSEPLTVTLQRSAATAPHFQQELKDTVAMENDKAEFLVHYRGTPTPKIAWFKDGFEIFSSRRTKILTETDHSSLVIFQAAFSDEGEIKCTATNRIGHVVTKAKLRLEAPPRIRLPRQYEDGLLFAMDEVIRLKVSVAGRPLPRVTWFHNGDQVVFGGRYEVANTDRYSSLRVGEARRDDRGEYQVKATNRLGEDVVSFLVTVTDRPVPPGKAKVVMTLGRSVTLSWTKPDDDGGCKIGNYIVEYYRLGWNVWLKAATCRQLTTTLGDLIEGSEYKFRVKAENPYGVSDPSGESEVVFIPDPKRGLMEAPARGSQSAPQPEMSTDQLKEDRKRHRPPPSREVNVPKRDKHVDSSMEYPSSDPDSSDATSLPKTLTSLKDTPTSRRRREAKEIPLTVLEYDGDNKREASQRKELRRAVEDMPLTPDSRKRRGLAEKENAFKTEKSKQESMSVPKTKPVTMRGVRTAREEPDDADLVPEVFSLQIPVGRPLSRNEDPMSRKSEPREESGRGMHGSSEMMLVLLPHTENAYGGSDDGQHAEFCRSFTESNNLGVAPPMSLSSPELGCGDPITLPALRDAVSSTELLHARAMERLYQEAAAEEIASTLSRRRSIERKRSFERGTETNQQARHRIRMDVAKEEKDPRVVSQISKEEATWTQKKQSPSLSKKHDDDFNTFVPSEKLSFQLTDEEKEEELEFARLRERIAQSLKEDAKEVEREMRYKKEDTPPEEEEYENEEEEEGTLDDEELEDESEESSYDEEAEEEEEEDDENPEEEDSEEDDEHYRTTTMSRDKTGKRSPPLRSMEAKRLSDDEEEEPYHPRSMVPRTLAVKEPPPPPVPIHREILTVKTLDDKAREITPPVRYEPKSDLQPKPILKMTSKFGKDDLKTKPKPSSPRASTPFGANEEKPKKAMMNKLLDKIEAPFKRSKTPPVKVPVESNVVVRRQKKESPPKPLGKEAAQEAERREGDVGLSAAEIARKRRLQIRQSSMEEDQEANKTIIDHYSDIVKEYGVPKKTSPILFMNTDDLKAAAESDLENSMSLSPEPVEDLQDTKSTSVQVEKKAPPMKTESKYSISASSKPRQQPTPSPKESRQSSLTRTPPSQVQPYQPSSTQASRNEQNQPNTSTHVSKDAHHSPTSQLISRDDDYVDEYSDEDEDVKWAYTPRQMMARIRRSLTPKRSFRRQRPDPAQLIKQAEHRVHNFVTYLTDLAMFLVACWLYLFKDERLAIPVLLLMVYRQMHEAILSWIPARWRKKRD